MSLASPGALAGAARMTARAAEDARLRRIVDGYHDFVWRSLRRMGVPEHAAEDAAQQVFLVLSHKLDLVAPENERSFLFGTVVRVASGVRRAQSRRREVAGVVVDEPVDDAPAADVLIDEKKARAVLDEILHAMPEDLRAVFVLFELEEVAASEVADVLGIPVGTVASRLRRAREVFHAAANRFKRTRGNLEPR
ncbi:MAG: sigma-70 family RNA polymerase sigma factor [Labilithrix sp.]|nr:sigma-70 family RNA polymerase sigma factor [Labilithrix sp.]